MQGKVQTQVYDSAQTSCSSPCTPLPTPQKGWVTTPRLTKEFKLAQIAPTFPIPSISHTEAFVPLPRVYFKRILESSLVLGRKAGLSWSTGHTMQTISGSELLRAETTEQRGRWSRKGSDPTLGNPFYIEVTLPAAAVMEIRSSRLGDMLHLKTSEMLACITVTITKLPRTR